MQALQERLARGDVLILDGPTATELERKGVSNASNAWSALANLHHPDVVRSVHEDYIRAGADVITTNTFPTSRLALETVGLAGRTREVNMRAVAIASEARERAAGGQEVAIAGSISHFLGWDRDDQGRYQFRDRPSMERLRKAFQEQAEVLAEAGCDLILLEMMRDVEMAGHAMEAAASTGLPVWTG
ncbi:MAG: homocysteine S-methyltransferase family protein, partial [Chloroflexi bacterium]|nr:homocysteine S-methyltransferase family protein [Chloroflexota bacterium]